MRWKWTLVPALVLVIAGAAVPAHSQVTYDAHEGNLPFTVGVGFSNFNDDWGITNPRQDGITAWVDWRLLLGALALGPGLHWSHRLWNRRLRPLFRDAMCGATSFEPI